MRRISTVITFSVIAFGIGSYVAIAAPNQNHLAPNGTPLNDNPEYVLKDNRGNEANFKLHKLEDLQPSAELRKHVKAAKIMNFGDSVDEAKGSTLIHPNRQVLVADEEYSNGDKFNFRGVQLSGTRRVIFDAETGKFLATKVTYDAKDAPLLAPKVQQK